MNDGNVFLSIERISVILVEVEDDVKSLWPWWIGLSMCYIDYDKEKLVREYERNLET